MNTLICQYAYMLTLIHARMHTCIDIYIHTYIVRMELELKKIIP